MGYDSELCYRSVRLCYQAQVPRSFRSAPKIVSKYSSAARLLFAYGLRWLATAPVRVVDYDAKCIACCYLYALARKPCLLATLTNPLKVRDFMSGVLRMLTISYCHLRESTWHRDNSSVLVEDSLLICTALFLKAVLIVLPSELWCLGPNGSDGSAIL